MKLKYTNLKINLWMDQLITKSLTMPHDMYTHKEFPRLSALDQVGHLVWTKLQ